MVCLHTTLPGATLVVTNEVCILTAADVHVLWCVCVVDQQEPSPPPLLRSPPAYLYQQPIPQLQQ